MADTSASIDLADDGGDATTSGGLGDRNAPFAIATAKVFVNADAAGAQADGFLGVNMCGDSIGLRGTPVGTAFANINTNQIVFEVSSPDGQPVRFAETYTGVITRPANGFRFRPFTGDAANRPPGTIIEGVNGENTVTAGYFELDGLSFNAGNTQGTPASFSGSYRLQIGTPPAPACCQPWDNGRADNRGGQLSQLNVDADWRPLVNVAFDDFWLCEGQVNLIDRVSGRMNTSAVVPKFLVVILPDCDGKPDLLNPLAVAGLDGTRWDVDQEDVPFILGRIEFTDTGAPDADGLRPIDVNAIFDGKRLVLKGGAYWTAFIGVSANLNQLDEFFWATSGNNVVKGRPGVFFDGDICRTSDELCCGCTDYNFCVEGESCKILLDNGPPITSFGPIQFPGYSSIDNGTNVATRSRAADKFVVPPCTNFDLCYIEGWMWTNCDRIALQFFDDDCRCPDDADTGGGLRIADCVMSTGLTINDPTGRPVTLKKAQFFFPVDDDLVARIGRGRNNGFNVWLSLVALGDNRQNARGYFAIGDRCDQPCTNFGPACIRPAPFATTRWRSTTFAGTSVRGFDTAFLIAVRPEVQNGGPTGQIACPADINRSGQVTVQDIFDYLAMWFTGCP